MADKGTTNQCNCCYPYHTAVISLNIPHKDRVYLKEEKKGSDRALALRPQRLLWIRVTREQRPVDVPHVAGIIKGNLCHPPIFPRPFTLIPLPRLDKLPTITFNLPFNPSKHSVHL